MENKGIKRQQNHEVLGIVNNLMVKTTNHGLPHIRESKGHIMHSNNIILRHQIIIIG